MCVRCVCSCVRCLHSPSLHFEKFRSLLLYLAPLICFHLWLVNWLIYAVSFLRSRGICRDSRHKRRHTGGKRKSIKKKRKFELGRPMASTKLGKDVVCCLYEKSCARRVDIIFYFPSSGVKRIHLIRTRGGNEKRRALRLEQGNFSWGSEGARRHCYQKLLGTRIHTLLIAAMTYGCPSTSCVVSTHKTRILDVVYNASDNDLLRTKTLVKVNSNKSFMFCLFFKPIYSLCVFLLPLCRMPSCKWMPLRSNYSTLSTMACLRISSTKRR